MSGQAEDILLEDRIAFGPVDAEWSEACLMLAEIYGESDAAVHVALHYMAFVKVRPENVSRPGVVLWAWNQAVIGHCHGSPPVWAHEYFRESLRELGNTMAGKDSSGKPTYSPTGDRYDLAALALIDRIRKRMRAKQ